MALAERDFRAEHIDACRHTSAATNSFVDTAPREPRLELPRDPLLGPP